MNVEITKAHLIILFVILFMSVGWIAPAAYASYAPQDSYIEVHEFSAAHTTTTAESHAVCFNRTVENPRTASVLTELYLIDGDGDRLEVDSRLTEEYFEEGELTIVTDISLPDSVIPGEYRYIMVVEMDLAQGRITRQFEFTSDKFTITESDETRTSTNTSYC
jgi:hypothetical protein